MTKFDTFIDMLKNGFARYARENWHEVKDAAIRDAEDFLSAAKNDLQRWTRSLAKGDLTRDDFEWLVESKKDLAQLAALKQIGLKKIALDRFLNGVLDLTVDTAFKIFL